MNVPQGLKVSAWPQKMKETEQIDNHIIASAILGVDITEVYSPERVNEVAKRQDLVPGSSLDLTNGWDCRQARSPPSCVEEDQS